MRNQYRVTKYDPSLRDNGGAFTGKVWTSRSDIGRMFGGALLTEAEYLGVEAAYLFAVEAFLSEAKVDALTLSGLESTSSTKLPQFAKNGATLSGSECVKFACLALREEAWGKLIAPGRAYVHFGYDYYMYFGLPSKCLGAVSAVQKKGLFVEKFRSPYLRQRPTLQSRGRYAA